VAGPGAGAVVLRLVDCSLLVPPRAGPDGRSRYVMLETLRAYAAGLLTEAGEADGAAAALAGYALRVVRQAAAGLQTITGEGSAARWLDAEDATIWSPRAAPMPRSPPSCTSASARSARIWTGSETRPAAAAAPT
jgi:hypothetical protein